METRNETVTLADTMADWATLDSNDPHFTDCAACRNAGIVNEACRARAAYQAAAHSMLREVIWSIGSMRPDVNLQIFNADKPWNDIIAGNVRFTVSLWFPDDARSRSRSYRYHSETSPSLDGPGLRIQIDAGYGNTRRFARKNIVKAACFIAERNEEIIERSYRAVQADRASNRRKDLLAKVATETGLTEKTYNDAQISDGKGLFLTITDSGAVTITLNVNPDYPVKVPSANLLTELLKAIQALR